MRRYTSAYVPMQNNASALGDLGALSWLAGMPALVCAGLESSTCLNFDGDSWRMCAYALSATGDISINSCADSRCMHAYMRAYAPMEYKPGFNVFVYISHWAARVNSQNRPHFEGDYWNQWLTCTRLDAIQLAASRRNMMKYICTIRTWYY